MKRLIRSTIDISHIPDENKNGDCFVVALNLVMDNPSYKLVHGIVTGQGVISGIQYCHAWVESGNVVIDDTVDIVIPKDIYYDIGNISITKEYAYKEALERALKYETYGPWDSVFADYP